MTPSDVTPPDVDKYVGCILGCAVGDAIGAVIEMRSRQNAADYVKDIVIPRNWAGVSSLPYVRNGSWELGQYTDDTQLTRELALSIVENGGFDPESFSERIAAIFAEGAVVGGGRATAEAAQALHLGTHWKESGTPLPRAGNGAAMRASPLGLLHWNDSEALLRDAWDQAIITHQAEMSCAPSVAIAMGTAMAVNASRDTSHPGESGWWDWLARFVDKAGSLDFAEDIRLLTLKHFKKQEKSSEILKWVRAIDQSQTSDPPAPNGLKVWDGISPWGRTSTLWALYSFMRSPKDFWKTLQTALLAGGDTDSMAAMACALSGAYNGSGQLMTESTLMSSLHDKGTWKASQLSDLARDLHKVATGQESLGEQILPMCADPPTLVPGDLVRYIPTHANGDIDHADCQNGVVTSTKADVVFVRYGQGDTSAATKRDQLVKVASLDDSASST